MSRFLEILVFLGLALGLHFLFAIRATSDGGAEAAGAGGTAMVSLAAAPASVEAMVEIWENQRRPALTTVVPTAAPQTSQQTAVSLPRPDLVPEQSLAAVALPFSPPAELAPPEIDLATPPAPEVDPEPTKPEPTEAAITPSPRPMQRPKNLLSPQKQQPELTSQQVDEKESKASAAVQKETAAGSGGSNRAGATGAAAAKALGAEREASFLSVWGGQIRASIESRKRFPRGAKGKGRVLLAIAVSTDGQVTRARVARSSGNPLYDQEAVAAVSRAGRLPRAPKELTGSRYDFRLPMDFSR